MKNNSWKYRKYYVVCGLALSVFICVPSLGWAAEIPAGPPSITLGSAQSFAVLAASAVTSTGNSIVGGNLGVSPGTAVSGFPPGVVNSGMIHIADAVAMKAQTDATAAYNAIVAQPCAKDLTGQDLGGLTLTPSVYCFSSSAQLTGQLVLDFQGTSKPFIFQIGSTLTTASASSVRMKNPGPKPGRVFWQVGSSATLGTTTRFVGNLITQASITLGTSARICGRALALTAAVTMDTNKVVRTCTPCFLAPADEEGSELLMP